MGKATLSSPRRGEPRRSVRVTRSVARRAEDSVALPAPAEMKNGEESSIQFTTSDGVESDAQLVRLGRFEVVFERTEVIHG